MMRSGGIRGFCVVVGAALLLPLATLAQTAFAQDLTAPVTVPAKTLVDAAVASASAKAEAAVATAKVEAVAASASAKLEEHKADDAKEKQADAQIGLAEARSGKLMAYGITIGYGAVAHTPTWSGTEGSHVRGWHFTGMPYLVVAPGYWLSSINAGYCANTYLNGDRADATTAAYAAARKRYLAGHPDVARKLEKAKDATEKDKIEDEILEGAKAIWDPTKDGKCAATRIGLFLGIPANFDASVVGTGGAGEVEGNIKPDFSFGLTFLPNAYITVLAGVSYSHFDDPAVTTAGGRERRIWDAVIGFGGNLDFLTALTSK